MEQLFKPSAYDVLEKRLMGLKGNKKQALDVLDKLKMLPKNMEERIVVVFLDKKPNTKTDEFDHTMRYQHFDITSFETVIEKKLDIFGKGESFMIHDGREVMLARRQEEAKQREEAFKKASGLPTEAELKAKKDAEAKTKAEANSNAGSQKEQAKGK